MNREEVEKCKQIAQTALAQGNPEKAVKFLEKAKRMSPEDGSLDALIAKAQSGEATPAGGGASQDAGFSNGPSSSAEGPRQRARATTAPVSSGATRTNKDGGKYTPEQSQEVQRILRTKDYYEILGLQKNADDDGVKKAYRKLALKLHPDKNKAPGSEEAFKKVSKAVQCIQDSEKRQQYDRYGDEESVPQHHRHRQQQDFMTPEDLFAAFFGGGTVHTHHHGQRGQQQQQQQQDGDGAQRANLFQMLPVLFLVFLTLASNFASRDNGSVFSFQASGHYTHERYSNSLNVNYFVTKDFGQKYQEGTKQMADFERQVEIYYVRQLHSDCDYQEKVMYKKVMIAKRRGSQDELSKARNHPRPACKEIEKVKKRHPTIYRSALYMGGF